MVCVSLAVRVNAVACEGYKIWFLRACVGFKANTKALGHDNLMYFCDPCKEMTRDMEETPLLKGREKCTDRRERQTEERVLVMGNMNACVGILEQVNKNGKNACGVCWKI